MPEIVACPDCERKIRVQDAMLGKKVKCPGCGVGFVARAAKEDDDEDEDEKPRKPARARRDEDEEEDEKPRKASKPARRDDDDEEEEDEKPKKKKRPAANSAYSSSALGLMLLMGAVGLVILIVLVEQGGSFIASKAGTSGPTLYNLASWTGRILSLLFLLLLAGGFGLNVTIPSGGDAARPLAGVSAICAILVALIYLGSLFVQISSQVGLGGSGTGRPPVMNPSDGRLWALFLMVILDVQISATVFLSLLGVFFLYTLAVRVDRHDVAKLLLLYLVAQTVVILGSFMGPQLIMLLMIQGSTPPSPETLGWIRWFESAFFYVCQVLAAGFLALVLFLLRGAVLSARRG